MNDIMTGSGSRPLAGIALSQPARLLTDAPAPPAQAGDLRACELAGRLTAQTRTVRIARGAVLLHGGDRYAGLHIVRAGSCKLVATSLDGAEQIASFRLPGEVIGLEAHASGVHDATVRALEPTTLWHLPPEHVEMMLRHDAGFTQALVHALSLEAARGMRAMLLLATMTAEQRVASFLLDLAARFRVLGAADGALVLRMTRADIGRHLGLSTETVSRVLSRFNALGLARVRGRDVFLRDRAAIERILQHRE